MPQFYSVIMKSQVNIRIMKLKGILIASAMFIVVLVAGCNKEWITTILQGSHQMQNLLRSFQNMGH